MSTPTKSHMTEPAGLFRSFVLDALSRVVTYVLISAAILLLDLFTGRFLQFPIFFVVPVALCAWFCSPRMAFLLAILLPAGRLVIAALMDSPSPVPFIVANALIRALVLGLIAFLVSRLARQTKELRQRIETLVKICAWSRTVEYQGEWLSFETYLRRRFNINTTHGICPAEAGRFRASINQDDDDA